MVDILTAIVKVDDEVEVTVVLAVQVQFGACTCRHGRCHRRLAIRSRSSSLLRCGRFGSGSATAKFGCDRLGVRVEEAE
jgi:hypothetical protein